MRNKNMLIFGVRRKIKIEEDQRRSASFFQYIMKFLTTVAYLGTIFPVLIITDFFLESYVAYDVVTYINKKQYVGYYGYYLMTETKHIEVTEEFYQHADPGDQLVLFYTPVFDTLKKIECVKDMIIYTCKPTNIYGWPMIAVILTLICSLMVLLKKCGNEDVLMTIGLFNVFSCIFILAFLLLK